MAFEIEGFLHRHRHAVQRPFPVALGGGAVCLARLLARTPFVEHDDGVELRIQAGHPFDVEVEQFDAADFFTANERSQFFGGEERGHGRIGARAWIEAYLSLAWGQNDKVSGQEVH